MKYLLIFLIGMNSFIFTQGQCISGDCVNGSGKIKYQNGEYEGMFFKGMKHGHGIYSWNTGSRYVGAYLNDQRTGRGLYTDSTYMYEGDFVNGRLTGWGKLTYTERFRNEQYYEGTFVMNDFHGFGTLYYRNGDIYTGAFLHDQRWGYGILKEASGTISMGYFLQGRQVGLWVIIDSDGKRTLIMK